MKYYGIVLSSLLLVSGSLAQSLKGCYKDDGSMNNLGSYTFQSQGYCSTTCKAQGFSVFGMAAGDECLCGASLPADSVANSFCNQACTGYPGDNCELPTGIEALLTIQVVALDISRFGLLAAAPSKTMPLRLDPIQRQLRSRLLIRRWLRDRQPLLLLPLSST